MFIGKKFILAATGLALATLPLWPEPSSAVTPNLNRTVISAPLLAVGQGFHACNVANVSSSAVYLKVDLINDSGKVFTSSTGAYVNIGAGQQFQLGGNQHGYAYCRVHLSGNVNNIRANLTVFRWTGAAYEMSLSTELR